MTVAEERRREVESRVGLPSRRQSAALSVVFFALTLLAITAMVLLFGLLSLPTGWPAAIVSIAVAELLMRRFQFSGTGVEAALWTGGLFVLALDHSGEETAKTCFLLAAASAIAGARVRNPYIGALTAVFVVIYLGLRHQPVAALITAIAIGAAPLAALAREWQRPSTERLMILLLIAGPLAGAFAGEDAPAPWSLAYFLLAMACVVVAVRIRHRGALVGGLVAAAIGVYMFRDLVPWSVEWKFIAGGALLFGISAATSRALSGRSRGFVVAFGPPGG